MPRVPPIFSCRLLMTGMSFDTKLQNLEMTFSKIRGDRRSQDDLLFKTIDGNGHQP